MERKTRLIAQGYWILLRASDFFNNFIAPTFHDGQVLFLGEIQITEGFGAS